MSSTQPSRPEIDETLLLEVAALPPGGQRWLKTALQAIATIEPPAEREEKAGPSATAREATGRRRGASLDEVLSGEAGAKEQAEAYPELAEELEGIADIANLLREAGRERRRLGEEILREEILGEPEPESESEEEDEEGEEGEEGT